MSSSFLDSFTAYKKGGGKVVRPTVIRTMRQMQGKSMKEVADVVGVTESTISRFERQGWVPPKYIPKYAEALQTTTERLDDLFWNAVHTMYEAETSQEGGEE